jgi:hypothetical protein
MKIDKNVPLPNVRASYAWAEMQIGDSVFFDNEPAGSSSKQAMASKVYAAIHIKKFSARKEGSGVRIWRVA